MGLQFFKVQKAIMSAAEKSIIEVLVDIRLSSYNASKITRLNDSDLANIRALATKLGEKILEANIGDSLSYNEARINFNRAIKKLPENNRFITASYSAQLLQYYTIVSAEEFVADQSIVAFNDFLTTNRTRFGDIDTNIFIAEYKLIKIYNTLCDLVDAKQGILAPLHEQEKLIDLIPKELAALRVHIDRWLLDAPDNVFIHYLSFAHHYSCAKTLELAFLHNEKSLSEEKKLDTAQDQDLLLKLAQDELKEIEHLQSNESVSLGSEFSLGQDVLAKMPVKELDAIQSHVAALRG